MNGRRQAGTFNMAPDLLISSRYAIRFESFLAQPSTSFTRLYTLLTYIYGALNNNFYDFFIGHGQSRLVVL